MKNCPQCYHENPLLAKFCNNCGINLLQLCPECKTSNPIDLILCMECGGSLQPDILGDKVTPVKKDSPIPRKAERRQLTILFCDLVDSTPLSERLDPEDYTQVITDYHKVA